jgi:hypothetical protein
MNVGPMSLKILSNCWTIKPEILKRLYGILDNGLSKILESMNGVAVQPTSIKKRGCPGW